MAKAKPLRRYLSLQFAAMTLLPVVIIMLLVWLFLQPLIRSNIAVQHQSIARAISGQILSHLMSGERKLLSLAEILSKEGDYSESQITGILDALCGDGELFETIFLIGGDDALIKNIGLTHSRRSRRDDFLGIDISARSFYDTARQCKKIVWSETFLSMVSSEMAVAVAVPIPGSIIIGEITLGKLSDFIGQLPVETKLRTLVLDRQGRIVADSLGQKSSQQIDLASLRDRVGNEGSSQSYVLDGVRLMGALVDIDRLGWKVWVIQPYSRAFKLLHVVLLTISAGLVSSLLIALLLAWRQSNKLSDIVGVYIDHAQAMAKGDYDLKWPDAKVIEYQKLGESLETMARTISERERQLVASETHMSITLDSIGDAVITTNAQGRVTRLNPVAEKLTGWASREAVGLYLPDIFNIVNSLNRKPAADPSKTIISTGLTVGLANHTTLISKAGPEYQIADSGAPIRDPNGDIVGVVLVFRDVTEAYAQQQKIQKNESRLRKLSENTPGVMFQIRSTKDDDLVTEFVSIKSFEIFGVKPDAPNVIEEFQKHIPEEDKDRFVESIRESMDSLDPWRYEGRFFKPGGKIIWMSGHAMPYKEDDAIVFYGLLMDNTWRRQMEDHLRLTQFTFDKASIGIFRIGEDGRILDVNEQGCKDLGYTREALCQLTIFDINPSITPDIWADYIVHFSGAMSQPIETDYRRKNGEIFPVQVLFSVMVFEGQTHRLSFVTDITERVRAKKEQEKLETQLRQAQKLEAIGKLSGGIAHDLNNLLTPILGYGELLLTDKDTDELAKDKLEQILQAGLGARDLVSQLLAFSRKQVLEYTPLDINQVLGGFEKLLRRTIRENIVFTIHQSPDMPLVMADVGQIEQVIMNLIVNASDAMPEGGKLIISTSLASLDATQTHQEVETGDFVMVSVSDTGCGMDEMTQAQIFEPFFSTKGNRGTGLGLSTVYGIIKQHRGAIMVYSEPGLGTTFKIYIPVSENIAPRVQVTKSSPSVLGGTETILLVEDDDKVRRTVRDILQEQGYKVLTAANSEDALEIMSTQGGRVRLMLADLIMTGMNGKELYLTLAKDYPALKVIYMSGYTDDIILHHGVLDEGIQFVQKPFTARSISTKIREVIDD